MTSLTFTVDKGVERFANALGALGENAPLALGRALRHTGDKARTQVVRALVKQTGLKRAVIVRAVKTRGPKYGDPLQGRLNATMTYSLFAKGGDISLKYFGAREIRAGVSAAPQGGRRLFAGAFMKAGRFPNRISVASLHGHVYRNIAGGKWHGKIQIQKSGVYIPDEMLKDASASAFETVFNRDLPNRVAHEIGILMKINGL